MPVPSRQQDPSVQIFKPARGTYQDHSFLISIIREGFPGGSVVKDPPASARDVDSSLGLRRSPREGNGNPLQCSRLGNPMGIGA